eukprot:1154336-Pelagomonas_calceolata.AAC.2
MLDLACSVHKCWPDALNWRGTAGFLLQGLVNKVCSGSVSVQYAHKLVATRRTIQNKSTSNSQWRGLTALLSRWFFSGIISRMANKKLGQASTALSLTAKTFLSTMTASPFSTKYADTQFTLISILATHPQNNISVYKVKANAGIAGNECAGAIAKHQQAKTTQAADVEISGAGPGGDPFYYT